MRKRLYSRKSWRIHAAMIRIVLVLMLLTVDICGGASLWAWAGSADGQTEVQAEVQADGQTEVQADGQTEVQTDGQTDGQAASVREKYRASVENALNSLFGKEEEAWYMVEPEFEGYDEWMADAHLMLSSYKTERTELKNAAFTYDNALVAMAFIAEGWDFSAENILDSFVYACEHDRYQPGRIRNAYMAGNINGMPFEDSDSNSARLPGWWDEGAKQWLEDQYQVGCNTGNTSYAALALLQYAVAFEENEAAGRYVQTAKTLMDWVINECSDGTAGFTGGWNGWPEADPPVVYRHTYKSIEHNIDAYAAFSRLYEVTGEERYADAAQSALQFIDSMYDRENSVFCSGTYEDGVTPNKENIVLDAQVWSALALGDAFAPYEDALSYAAKMRQPDGGYAFCLTNENGGWWPEGSAFTALMHLLRGEKEEAEQVLDALCSVQSEGGLFPAATTENLSTGLYQFDGSPLLYSTDLHIAPTAWFIMAVNGFNPYVFTH